MGTGASPRPSNHRNAEQGVGLGLWVHLGVSLRFGFRDIPRGVPGRPEVPEAWVAPEAWGGGWTPGEGPDRDRVCGCPWKSVASLTPGALGPDLQEGRGASENTSPVS